MRVIVNFIVLFIALSNVFKIAITKEDSDEAASDRIAIPAVYSIENVHQWQKPRPFAKRENEEDKNNFYKIQSPSEVLQNNKQHAPIQFDNDLYKNNLLNTSKTKTEDKEEENAEEEPEEEEYEDGEHYQEKDDLFEDPEDIYNLNSKIKSKENEKYFDKGFKDNHKRKDIEDGEDEDEDEDENYEEEEYNNDEDGEEDEEEENEELNYDDYETDEEAESQFHPVKTNITHRFIIYEPKDNIAEATVYEANPSNITIKQDEKKKEQPEKFKEEKHSSFKGDKIIEGNKSGKKAYDGHHKDEKELKGHHKKEKNSDQYDETDGKKKKHHSDYKEESKDFKSEEGEKDSHFSEKGEHEKGHTTNGMHNIEKIDEFEKNYEFYDEFHEGGENEKHGGHHLEHEHDGGGSLKQKHFEKGNGEEKYKKKDFNKHDVNYDEDKKSGEGYKKFAIHKQKGESAKKNKNDGFLIIKY